MASADFPEPLGSGISLGQCQPCPFTPSGSTVAVDDSGALLVLACSPAAFGLTASSCPYGRRFASGPFAPVPYGSSLTFGYGCRHLPVGDLSPREGRHLLGTRAASRQSAAIFPVRGIGPRIQEKCRKRQFAATNEPPFVPLRALRGSKPPSAFTLMTKPGRSSRGVKPPHSVDDGGLRAHAAGHEPPLSPYQPADAVAAAERRHSRRRSNAPTTPTRILPR